MNLIFSGSTSTWDQIVVKVIAFLFFAAFPLLIFYKIAIWFSDAVWPELPISILIGDYEASTNWAGIELIIEYLYSVELAVFAFFSSAISYLVLLSVSDGL